jgi:hypothetical protein
MGRLGAQAPYTRAAILISFQGVATPHEGCFENVRQTVSVRLVFSKDVSEESKAKRSDLPCFPHFV